MLTAQQLFSPACSLCLSLQCRFRNSCVIVARAVQFCFARCALVQFCFARCALVQFCFAHCVLVQFCFAGCALVWICFARCAHVWFSLLFANLSSSPPSHIYPSPCLYSVLSVACNNQMSSCILIYWPIRVMRTLMSLSYLWYYHYIPHICGMYNDWIKFSPNVQFTPSSLLL